MFTDPTPAEILAAAVRWNLDWGDKVDWLEDLAAEDPENPPRALLERPEIPSHLQELWHAFVSLSTCRPLVGGSVGPIPWVAIDCYARRYGIDGEEFERLTEVVAAMDSAFISKAIEMRAARETQES